MPTVRTDTRAGAMLRLDGADIGLVRSAEGGAAVGDVISVRSGSEMTASKHLTTLRFEPIEIQIGVDLNALSFHNVGIFKLALEKAAANTDAIQRARVEMYCERMGWSVK